ncbi:hypothetical protein, partial [Campylobacter coli]|uniref:hypothetical protein n=1 Tax=Campylobacter coli TaxID=195 RepID=UPI003F8236FA|nr:hypothetical protein [Campylobacter coli]MCE7158058.1 hypothetical protein [Campylobacter coli]
SSFLLLSFSIILPYLIVDLKLCNRTYLYKLFLPCRYNKIESFLRGISTTDTLNTIQAIKSS